MSEPERSEPALARWPVFLAGVGFGLLAAYVLDPQNGRDRRTRLLDHSHNVKHRTWHTLISRARDLTSTIHSFFSRSSEPAITNVASQSLPLDDAALVQRVRNEFGYAVRFGQAIRVDATQGVVTLSGPVLTENIGRLLTCVKSVPGVRSVIDELDRHERESHVSH